jgi:DtxR family Mn-dependent transcriptional regulator
LTTSTVVLLLLALSILVLLAFWPRGGALRRVMEWRRVRERESLEDALKHLADAEILHNSVSADSLAAGLGLSPFRLAALLDLMKGQGLVDCADEAVRLSPAGRQRALQVLRAHRLWERYLADEARLPVHKVHRAAHHLEHRVSAEQVEELGARLGHPQSDPHGDPIPSASGVVADVEAAPLADWPSDKPARIVHLEDEPAADFKEILAAGWRTGAIVEVLERGPDRLLVAEGGLRRELDRRLALNIHVTTPSPGELPQPLGRRLSDLPDGRQARIVAIDPSCQGFTRRRLLDLGLTPGALIRADLRNALGDPRGFLVRGSLVALRREQASLVWVDAHDESDFAGDVR